MRATTAVVRGAAATRSGAPSSTPKGMPAPGMPAPRGRGALKRTPTIHFVASAETKVSLFVQRALSNFYFQGLTFCIFIAILFYKSMVLCSQQEFLFHKMVQDTLFTNTFDSALNSFYSIRRVSDVWEWGAVVLWPGLLGNAGPCGTMGVELGFRSSQSAVMQNVTAALSLKGCMDHSWPDGTGEFGVASSTPYSISEIVESIDMFDWFDGVLIRTVRAASNAPANCGTTQYGSCYDSPRFSPELGFAENEETASFGYNWTDPSQPLEHPWGHFDCTDLGLSCSRTMSNALASYGLSYPPGGFVAAVIPFFSPTFLPEQKGTHEQVIDMKSVRCNRTANDAQACTPRFHCVRLSWNGQHLHQLCDPMADGRVTGVVRAAIESFWTELKRAHFIDARTRLVEIVMPLRSNHMGLRYDLSIKLQQLPTRSWVPSTSILTRLENDEILKTMSYLLPISLAMCVFFIFSDLVDLWRFGWRSYLSSGWNVVDWLSYGIFVGYYCSMQVGWNVADSFDSRLYQQVGFRYDVDSMEWFRSAKIYLSITLVVQIIKVIKFSDQIMPRTALFSSVLSVALPNLLFFMFSFGLTLVAFAMMLSVQMGNVLGEFDTFVNSLVSPQ